MLFGYPVSSHLSIATTYWCMVFGAVSNATHWKKTFNAQNIINQFKVDLLNHLGIKDEEWIKYWEDITYFENKYIPIEK